jgi:hypothetical protein
VAALVIVLVLQGAAAAQETALTGTATDATDAVLPGVTVTATHVDSGNTFVAVTDASGVYRIGAMRPGVYTVTSELPGFNTVKQEKLEILLGQRGVLNIRMALSNVETVVTVTSEAPLVDVTRTAMGGNIDPRQMQELPVNGRNWMDLSLLAPGAKRNAVEESPVGGDSRNFQLNIDGQQVTNMVSSAGFGQPRFSRDAIAEFELVTNRFDATQGRSMSSQVNAITKSGTNKYAGTLSGYFRDDKFNARDFVVNRVLPYSNEQISWTLGGPIVRDRVHFFGNYEYEREPLSFTFTSPLYSFPDLKSARQEHKGGVRLDTQFSTNTRLMVRGMRYSVDLPNDTRSTGGATLHPSASNLTRRTSTQAFASLSQVLGSNLVHELRGGFTQFHFFSDGVVPHSPRILLVGYSLGKPTNYMQDIPQNTYQIRSDLTYRRTIHELKVGGEWIYNTTCLCPWMQYADAEINATRAPVPAGFIGRVFPVWNDVSTWNLAALSPYTISYRKSVGTYTFQDNKKIFAAYVQDNWTLRDLTLNLGLRYDLSIGAMAEHLVVEPFLPAPRPSDTLNLQPRLGFTYKMSEKTVVRGGFGKYFGEFTDAPNYSTNISRLTATIVVPNDGRPDFAANPFNGAPPPFEQALSYPNRSMTTSIVAPDFHSSYSWQSSIGLQQQVSNRTSVQADYVYQGGRRDVTTRNANLSYDPVTGAPNRYAISSTRPYPAWGIVQEQFTDGWSNQHSLEMALSKRFSNNWQASVTYTLAFLRNADGAPTGPCLTGGVIGSCPPGFRVTPDFGGDYTYGVGDQRHRAVFNGIWMMPYRFELSGLYFYGSGERFATTYGQDLRLLGDRADGRLRPDGTLVARNALVGKPLHRLDIRVLRKFPLYGKVKIDGMVEVFNVLNHANYGAYVTQERLVNYGAPAQNTNVAYQPRMLQLGFRLVF